MFATKKPAALRQRLAEIDRDVKLVAHSPTRTMRSHTSHPVSLPRLTSFDQGKYSFADVTTQATEILVALKKLGEPLQPKEEVRVENVISPHHPHSSPPVAKPFIPPSPPSPA
jgi:hypothetical protein